MAAKTEVVSYYMDPRNFFTPKMIFMFEMLGFDPKVHTVEGVKEIIRGSFMDNDPQYDYAQIIYEAGKNAGVSPYFLASRIIQEMGYSGESALSRGDLTGYEGYYNFFISALTPRRNQAVRSSTAPSMLSGEGTGKARRLLIPKLHIFFLGHLSKKPSRAVRSG